MFPASRRIVRDVPSSLMFVQPWLYASSFAHVLAFVQRCHLLCVLSSLSSTEAIFNLVKAWNFEPGLRNS